MTEDDMTIGEMPDMTEDETVRDVVAALSVLPAVSEADVQRIVARAAGAAAVRHRGERRWASIPMAAAATLVLAAGIGGYALRAALPGGPQQPAKELAATSASSGGQTSAVPAGAVASAADAEAPIMTQFVFESSSADRVAIVGAFNSWDAGATPLVRDPATRLWTVTLPLAPGRHVYAFVVNDSALTLDPRAPTASDPELGSSASVILVGTP